MSYLNGQRPSRQTHILKLMVAFFWCALLERTPGGQEYGLSDTKDIVHYKIYVSREGKEIDAGGRGEHYVKDVTFDGKRYQQWHCDRLFSALRQQYVYFPSTENYLRQDEKGLYIYCEDGGENQLLRFPLHVNDQCVGTRVTTIVKR